MRKHLAAALLFVVVLNSYSQPLQRPKLVIGIVVDQMRWDFLFRYNSRYAENGGFKRLMNKGFNCNNTLISYTPSYTFCGHAAIYTVLLPSIHSITGTNWYDNEKQSFIFCKDGTSAPTLGGRKETGKMSPVILLTTSVCDEPELATNLRTKVIGIALKYRGRILPSGHSPDAAFWFDSKTGDWITSTHCVNELPEWENNFNKEKRADKYYMQGWNTLYPLKVYYG